MSENAGLLTQDDFLLPAAPSYFACVLCKVDSTCILRHSKSKYIAVFSCSNGDCLKPHTEKWYKCRVCTRKDKDIVHGLKKHLKQQGHQARLKIFEERKSASYKLQENRFVKEDVPVPTMEMDVSVSENGPSERPIEVTIGKDMEMETSSHCHFECFGNNNGAEIASFSQNFDDWNSNQLDDATEVAPATVEEWQARLLSESREADDDLSAYFLVEEEDTPTFNYKRRPRNVEYYHYNRHCGYGPRYITARAIEGNTSPSIVTSVPAHKAMWSMLVAKFADTLTSNQQKMFVGILGHTESPLAVKNPLPIPRDQAELRRCYTLSGRQSIPNLLPRPIIQRWDDDDFVYVSIRDILQFHLANGQRLDPLVDLPHSGRSRARALHGSSPRGKALVTFALEPNHQLDDISVNTTGFPSEVVIWSDGFDTNNTKNNRGSAHIILVSIGTPEDDYHAGLNTYPVSLGPANGDMSRVVKLLVEDLTKLFHNSKTKNMFFDAKSQKQLAVFLRVYCFLQDRPERCSWLHLAHGNGKYAGRFGWAGDLHQQSVYEKLPSCSACNTKRLISPLARDWQCSDCQNWCMDGLQYKTPDDYPTIFRKDNTSGHHLDATNPAPFLPRSAPMDPRLNATHLRFRRISVKELMSACDATFEMVRSKHWTKKQGIAYLETFALSPEYILQICNAAVTSTEEQPPYPATWSIPKVDICDHIDVLMHLCFLGITKANSADLINGWLKLKRMSSSFLKKSKPVLAQIKVLGLSWCAVETKFGGYVSENWVAYCRISKYIHQLLSNLERTDEVYQDPYGVPLSQYTFKQKKAWLRARQVDGINSTSTKESVDNAFGGYVSLEAEDLPPIVKPIASKASLEEVNYMITCWHVCMSRVMSLDQNPSDEQVWDIDRHMKLFLTAVDVFDTTRRQKAIKKDQKVPVWRRKPNYLGILNYRETIRVMGPLCRLTELDLKGEASIKHLKSKINHGLSGNWAYNALLRYYIERSFRFVMKDCVEDLTNELGENTSNASPMLEVVTDLAGKALPAAKKLSVAKTNSDDSEMNSDDSEIEIALIETSPEGIPTASPRNYKSFKDEETAWGTLNGKGFVSGVVIDDHLYLVIASGKSMSCLEIQPITFRKEVCGAEYFSYTTMASNAANLGALDVVAATEFFILLPLLDADGTISNDAGSEGESNYFYLITSGWREISKNDEDQFVLRLPNIPGATYTSKIE